MTVKECYEQINGDYEGVFGRFRGDERIKKFALKFLADGSYDSLCRTLEAEDYSEAFRAAHTLKGVSQNLGFDGSAWFVRDVEWQELNGPFGNPSPLHPGC